jgi:hypothetical protein
MVMLCSAELRRRVALTANGVQVFGSKLETMWIVAVRAGDTLVIHLALDERAILVVLFLDLAIREVNALVQ